MVPPIASFNKNVVRARVFPPQNVIGRVDDMIVVVVARQRNRLRHELVNLAVVKHRINGAVRALAQGRADRHSAVLAIR